MDLGAFLDASAAALIGVLGVWAALGRGHWFMRFLVATPLLIMPVVIPAYEMVYHHSFAVLLIVLAIGFYHQWRPWRWRFPVRTILLGMVVVATFGAVIVNSPEFTIGEWLGFLGIGAAIAVGTLLCLWGVCGGGSWFRRAVVLFFSFMLLNCVGFVVYVFYRDIVWRGGVLTTFENLSNGQFSSAYFNSEWFSWWFQYYASTGLVAALFALSLLSLGRFGAVLQIGNQERSPSVSTRIPTLCRYALAASLVLLSMFPGYVFYRLLTPEPYPVPTEGVSEDIDLLVALGEELELGHSQQQNVLLTGRAAVAASVMREVSPILRHADRVLEQSELQLAQYFSPNNDENEVRSVYNVFYWVLYRHMYYERFGPLEKRIESVCSFLNAGSSFNKQAGFGLNNYGSAELFAARSISEMMVLLDEIQTQLLLDELIKYDRQRLSLAERIKYQRLWDVNLNWQTHLQSLLAEWSSTEQYKIETEYYYSAVRRTGTVILQLALHQYYLEHKGIPNALTDLVPEYLEALPEDPICKEPLQYQRLWSGYVLTSGCDADPNQAVFVTGPSGPYMAEQLKNYSLKAWTWLGKTIAAPR